MIKQKMMMLFLGGSIFFGTTESEAMNKIAQKLENLKQLRLWGTACTGLVFFGVCASGDYLEDRRFSPTSAAAFSTAGALFLRCIFNKSHKGGKLIKTYEKLLKGFETLQKIDPHIRKLTQNNLEWFSKINREPLMNFENVDYLELDKQTRSSLNLNFIGVSSREAKDFFEKLIISWEELAEVKSDVLEAHKDLKVLEELGDVQACIDLVTSINRDIYSIRGTISGLQKHTRNSFREILPVTKTLLEITSDKYINEINKEDLSRYVKLQDVHEQLSNYVDQLMSTVGTTQEHWDNKELVLELEQYLFGIEMTMLAIKQEPGFIKKDHVLSRIGQAHELLQIIN